MNRQYTLADECLKLLREKDINTMSRLRIDIQLVQLKGLLLVRDMDDAEADSFMVSLLAVCRNIAKVDKEEPASTAFEEVTCGLQSLIESIALGQNPGVTSRVLDEGQLLLAASPPLFTTRLLR